MEYLYILASKRNGTIYVGSTTDLENRIRAHKDEAFDGFTKKYNVKSLVYFEEYKTKSERLLRERQLKKWKRSWKVRLIEENNPGWEDLSSRWFN